MTKTQLKCSNCGAEVTNLNFDWNQKTWTWFAISMVIVLISIPIALDYLNKDRSDFRTDLAVQVTDQRFSDGLLEIIGTVENTGDLEWEDIVVQAELYSADGEFLDEVTRYIYSNVRAGETENFVIESKKFPECRWEAIERIEIKIAEARSKK